MSTHSPMAASDTTRVQSDSFQASTLSVALTVKDLQQSLAWYRDIVGFTVDQQHEREGTVRAVSLKAGVVRILIGQDDGAKGWDRRKGEGISLHVTTAQNIDELANRIKALGGTLETEPADMWGMRVFRVQDLDGFKLTISSER